MFLFRNDDAYISMLNHSSVLRYRLAFLMVGCMAMMSLLWYTQQEQKEMDAEKSRRGKTGKRSRTI